MKDGSLSKMLGLFLCHFIKNDYLRSALMLQIFMVNSKE